MPSMSCATEIFSRHQKTLCVQKKISAVCVLLILQKEVNENISQAYATVYEE